MTKLIQDDDNQDEKLEINNTQEGEKVDEKSKIPVVKYTRPPSFINANNFSKWKSQQNANMTKMVRRSWWRGR